MTKTKTHDLKLQKIYKALTKTTAALIQNEVYEDSRKQVVQRTKELERLKNL